MIPSISTNVAQSETSKSTSLPPLILRQPYIPAFALLPAGPRSIVRLLQISHPPPGIKQRATPPRFVQQLPQFCQPTPWPMALVHTSQPQLHRSILVLRLILHNKLLRSHVTRRPFRQRALEDRGGHARAHLVLVPRQREQRSAGPQHVGGRCVRVALGRVKEEVAYAGSRDVLMLGRDVGEKNARGNVFTSPQARCRFKVRLSQIGEAKKPEDGFRKAGEDAEPRAKCCWFNLERLVSRSDGNGGHGSMLPCTAD